MSDDKPGDAPASAGRGGLAIAGAKAYFILIGFVQQTLLGRLLGADGYGAYSSVMAIANVADNVVISSSIQGTSRTVAEASSGELDGAQRRTLSIHAALALPIAGLFAVFAPMVARASGAPHVAAHARVAALIVFGYCLYTPLVGALNGRRRFLAQAALDVGYATLRTVTMLGGAYLFASSGAAPLGAVSGFALAALSIVPIAAAVAGLGRRGPGGPALSEYLRLLWPLALAQLFLNMLMQSDITLLRYFASERAAADGLLGVEAALAADRTVGVYRACQLFAFLPYQLLLSVTFILFPLLARAHADGDAEAVKTYVRTGLRLSLVIGGAMVAVIAGLGPLLLSLAFKPEIAEPGGRCLRVLALGQGAFALYGVFATVLSSLHRERWSMALNAVATGLVVAASWAIVPGAGQGAALAERAAWATSAALLVAAASGAVAVWRVAGALVSPWTLARVLLAGGLAGAIPAALGWQGKIVALALAAIVGAAYLAALVVTRELGRAALELVLRVARRRR